MGSAQKLIECLDQCDACAAQFDGDKKLVPVDEACNFCYRQHLLQIRGEIDISLTNVQAVSATA